jgi:acetoin utilization deacetylase AcuC-like enzyme
LDVKIYFNLKETSDLKQTAFFHDELCLWHTTGEHALIMPIGGWVQPPATSGHAESPESKRRLKTLMDVSGLTARLDHRSAPPATEEDLLRVHDAAYLKKFKEVSDAGGGDLGIVAPFGRGSYEIACLAAGLAKQAMADVLAGNNPNAYALSRPPGHHCLREQSMGFCLLANIAIGIEAARAFHGVEKVAVVDWDVHHGNGTQSIFYGRADVLTISLHQESCFPPGSGLTGERGEGPGQGYNINIPLLPGGGHDVYLYAMQRLVIPALQAYRPDLIIVASGLDANGVDPLARMLLHSDSYRAMTQLLLEIAADLCQGRLVVAHEGGYAESYVPFCGLALIETLAGERTQVEDPILGLIISQQPSERFNTLQRQILDEMAESYEL